MTLTTFFLTLLRFELEEKGNWITRTFDIVQASYSWNITEHDDTCTNPVRSLVPVQLSRSQATRLILSYESTPQFFWRERPVLTFNCFDLCDDAVIVKYKVLVDDGSDYFFSIMSRLDIYDIGSIATTCRRMRDLSAKPLLWASFLKKYDHG